MNSNEFQLYLRKKLADLSKTGLKFSNYVGQYLVDNIQFSNNGSLEGVTPETIDAIWNDAILDLIDRNSDKFSEGDIVGYLTKYPPTTTKSLNWQKDIIGKNLGSDVRPRIVTPGVGLSDMDRRKLAVMHRMSPEQLQIAMGDARTRYVNSVQDAAKEEIQAKREYLYWLVLGDDGEQEKMRDRYKDNPKLIEFFDIADREMSGKRGWLAAAARNTNYIGTGGTATNKYANDVLRGEGSDDWFSNPREIAVDAGYGVLSGVAGGLGSKLGTAVGAKIAKKIPDIVGPIIQGVGTNLSSGAAAGAAEIARQFAAGEATSMEDIDMWKVGAIVGSQATVPLALDFFSRAVRGMPFLQRMVSGARRDALTDPVVNTRQAMADEAKQLETMFRNQELNKDMNRNWIADNYPMLNDDILATEEAAQFARKKASESAKTAREANAEAREASKAVKEAEAPLKDINSEIKETQAKQKKVQKEFNTFAKEERRRQDKYWKLPPEERITAVPPHLNTFDAELMAKTSLESERYLEVLEELKAQQVILVEQKKAAQAAAKAKKSEADAAKKKFSEEHKESKAAAKKNEGYALRKIDEKSKELRHALAKDDDQIYSEHWKRTSAENAQFPEEMRIYKQIASNKEADSPKDFFSKPVSKFYNGIGVGYKNMDGIGTISNNVARKVYEQSPSGKRPTFNKYDRWANGQATFEEKMSKEYNDWKMNVLMNGNGGFEIK